MDDEPLGGDAGLAVVLHPAGDGGADRGVQIGRRHNDERVAAAELEHGRLDLVTGDSAHRLAGRLASGQRGRRDPGITQDGFDGSRANKQRLEAAVREAASGDDVGQVQRALRHVRRVLEQADVSGHQCRCGEPNRLPQGEVPWHHRQDHPERLVSAVGRRRPDLGRIGGFVGQQRLGVFGVVAKTLGALQCLGFGRGQRLAHLERHHRGGLVGLGFQQVGGGIGPPGALGEAGLAVVGEPPVGPGYCRVDFVIGRRSECLDCFAGSRVDGGDGHADILCWVGLHKSSGVQPATNVASAPEQEVSGPPIGWGGLYHGQDQRGGTCHRSHVRRELIGPFNRPVARRLCVATSAGRSARSACGATRLGPVAARPRW